MRPPKIAKRVRQRLRIEAESARALTEELERCKHELQRTSDTMVLEPGGELRASTGRPTMVVRRPGEHEER